MKVVETLWVSPNKKWVINLIIHPRTNRYRLEVTDGFYSDLPIFYDHGGFAFDYPERIPNYVKEQVRKYGYKLKKAGVL